MDTIWTLEAAAESGGNNTWWIMIIIYAVIILGAYFLLIRPQSKKKKKDAANRKNAKIGDEITTIGGIVGRIVAVKEESDSIKTLGNQLCRDTSRTCTTSSCGNSRGQTCREKRFIRT